MHATDRTLSDFSQLSAAEGKLIADRPSGDVVYLGHERPDKATADNRVRASFLRFVMLDADKTRSVHESGVRLHGAYIVGILDLSGTVLTHSLGFWDCTFEFAPDLTDAQLNGSLWLIACASPGVIASRVNVRGAMVLRGLCCAGRIDIAGAHIGGELSLNDAAIDGGGGPALFADRVHVEGSFFLGEKFSAKGDVTLIGARIGGQFCCTGTLKASQSAALTADGITVDCGVLLVDGFCAEGAVRFVGAHIVGQFICRDASFDGKSNGALFATGLVMTGSVLLHKGFRAKGLVQLIGARIEGDLVCEKGAVFEGDEHYALVAARCVVTGKVRLGEDFHAHKSVNFTDARIATGFDGCGAWFEGRTGASLVLDRAQVSGPLLLRALQSKLANASFVGAKVTELDDDEQTWGENLALNGFVYGALSARAPVSPKIRSAWLRQQIPSLEKDRPAAELAKDFRPQPWRQLQRVLVEMGHAGEARELGIIYEQQLRAIGHVGQPPSGWPTWIAAIYSRIALGLHALYGLLTGYGYRPMQLLFWFVGIWLSCASVFWYAAAQQGVFAPSDPLVFQNPAYLDCRPDRGQAWRLVNPGQETDPSFYGQGNWYLCDSLREEYTGFSPLAYSLDVLMPLVDLQQEADWAPLVPTPKQGFWDEFTAFGWKHFVRLLIWFEVLVGWGISLLMVAIVSGLARRSE